MATAPTANDLTRQQLDELDNLLQRMLALPLTPGESPTTTVAEPVRAPGAKNWRLDTPAATAAPHVVTAPPAASVFAPDPPRPIDPTLANTAVQSAAPVAPAPARFTPPPAPAKPLAAASPFPSPPLPPPPTPAYLWPLIALNWVFDTILYLFGPPGRLLTTRFGKNLLGFAGVGLLVLTGLRVLQRFGFVSSSLPVPWPG